MDGVDLPSPTDDGAAGAARAAFFSLTVAAAGFPARLVHTVATFPFWPRIYVKFWQ
jgi:hypothetical protein